MSRRRSVRTTADESPERLVCFWVQCIEEGCENLPAVVVNGCTHVPYPMLVCVEHYEEAFGSVPALEVPLDGVWSLTRAPL